MRRLGPWFDRFSLAKKPEDNAGQEQENGEPGRQNRAIAALPAADDPNRSLLQE